MAGQTSNLIQYAISPEATPGTYAAPVAGEYLCHGGGTFNDGKEMTTLEVGKGSISTMQERRISKLMADGNIPTPLGSVSAGNILAAIFGQYDASPTGTDPYTHTYTVKNDNAHQTFSIVRVDDQGQQRHFTYGMLDSASFTADMNGSPIMMDMAWSSKPSEAKSDVTPSYSDETFLYPDNLTFDIVNSGVAFGTLDEVINTFTLTFTKNVLNAGQLGTNSTTRLWNQNFQVTGSVVTYKENDTAFNEALTNQDKAIQAKFVTGTNSITFNLNDLTFGTPTNGNDINGIETLTREFEVHDAANNVTAVLVNSTALYPLT